MPRKVSTGQKRGEDAQGDDKLSRPKLTPTPKEKMRETGSVREPGHNARKGDRRAHL